MMEDRRNPMSDYDRIEKTIRYLEKHFQEQPSLEEMARFIHLSPFHFQRLFQKWAGVSPKQFIQYLTAGHAKRRLMTRGFRGRGVCMI
jgi:AraC family transcriptional regulator of adaptative response/methylated-DNA-[protein]-cysteine methyltransferase